MSISQGKLELSVLWALVTLDFEEFADCSSVGAVLGHVAKEARVRAAIKFLISQEMVEDCSAPLQEHFEATRKGIQLIERLKEWPNPKGFIKNLDASGISLLSSPDADGEQIDIIWKTKQTEGSDAKTNVGAHRNHEPPINVTVAPTFNNSNNFSPPQASADTVSSKIGTWFGAWGAWGGVLLTGLSILVALLIAGKL